MNQILIHFKLLHIKLLGKGIQEKYTLIILRGSNLRFLQIE